MAEHRHSSSGASATGLFLGIASLSAGAYHGYCHAQGIPVEPASLETALTWGPMIVRGATGGLAGLLVGGIGGTAFGASKSGLGGAAAGGTLGCVGGTLVGGGIGAMVGGVQTLIGYGIGYGVGALTR